MHIKEVCLEGFKSYAGRTVVPGFDPLFNAITGLNGSGKSNILDSICFVLGITDLRQVRAASLQELVYKQGQAGVTKATVSIVFDNSDRARSPLGYEDSPEITVTRQVSHPHSSPLLFAPPAFLYFTLLYLCLCVPRVNL
jgi:structural maintenance of chromosome 2